MRSKDEKEEVTQVTQLCNIIIMTLLCVIMFTACTYNLTVVQTQGTDDDFEQKKSTNTEVDTDLTVPFHP